MLMVMVIVIIIVIVIVSVIAIVNICIIIAIAIIYSAADAITLVYCTQFLIPVLCLFTSVFYFCLYVFFITIVYNIAFMW